MQTPPGLKPWNDPLLLGFLRPYVAFALGVTVLLTIGMVSTFILMSGNPLSWEAYQWQIIALFYVIPVGILGIGLLSYMSRRQSMKPADIDALLNPRRRLPTSRLVQGGVVVVLISLAMPLQYLYMHPPSTQPSSWATQLAAAQAEARKVDPAMVLDSVRAEPVNSYKITHIDAATTFSVEFTFLRPSGEATTVTMLDTDPPRLVEVRSVRYRSGPPQDEASQAAHNQLLATVQLSPRDVYRQTLAEAVALGEKAGTAVHPSIGLNFDGPWSKTSSVPTVWFIIYSADHDSVLLWIHPGTGEILKRKPPE